MVVIYGVRNYGSVDAHGGEHAQTQFFHVYWLPLFPTGSSWVTGPRPDGTNAHGIKLNGKSVLSGYLRIWGPIIAIANLSIGFSKPAHLIVAAIAALASVWAWTTLKLRGAAAQRRSDFNYVAYGTRCEPKKMFASHRAVCKKQLDERWRELAPKHSPNEVAQHGADNASEAVLSYGLLRLSSLDRGGATDGAAADRILDGRFDAPSTMDGPYRAGPSAGTDATTAAALAELVAQRDAQGRVTPLTPPPDPVAENKRKRRRSRLQLAGLVFLTMAAVGGTLGFVASLRPAVDASLSDLRGIKPPLGRIVHVTCESVEGPLWEETNKRGETLSRIAMCRLGKYLLPIKVESDGPLPGRQITGKLREVEDRLVWVRDGLRRDREIEERSLDVYVDTTDASDLGPGIAGLVLAVATPVLWILWFRARRRRIAAAT